MLDIVDNFFQRLCQGSWVLHFDSMQKKNASGVEALKCVIRNLLQNCKKYRTRYFRISSFRRNWYNPMKIMPSSLV